MPTPLQRLLQTVPILRSVNRSTGLSILHSRETMSSERSLADKLDRESLHRHRNDELSIRDTNIDVRRTRLTLSRTMYTLHFVSVIE